MVDKTRADFQQADLSHYSAEYALLNDVWDCLVTQDKLAQYLPRRGKGKSLESNDSYLLRLQTTSLPRAFRDGIEKGAGRFGLAKLTEDTPAAIQDIENNFDGQGGKLDSFVFRILINLLKCGCLAVVVDIVNDQIQATIAPVSSLRNRAIVDNKLVLLTVEHIDELPDEHDIVRQYRYQEYKEGELLSWTRNEDEDKLLLDEENSGPLTEANGDSRNQVYAVWFSVDPETPKWTPCAPPFVGLAKKSILQMLKTSELDRAETICNMQVLKRTHPQGADPNATHPDITWDPECVVEIPFGGKLEVDEPRGTAIATTHERNKDRQAEMDRAVDTWLMEKVRTATESAIADDAEKTRLEIVSKVVQQGMSEVFRFMMRLADRRFDPENDDAGGITLTATAFSQVTDEEIQLATQDFTAQTLSLQAIKRIKLLQWQSRGYPIEESDMFDLDPTDELIEG